MPPEAIPAGPLPPAAPPDAPPNQFALLRQRRFAPFFWTQFGGAANDNLFKFAFTVLVTYQVELPWLPPELAGPVIGAFFILPFLLFSATSGQLADKYDKARLMRLVKNLEIAIMLLAAAGFGTGQAPLLLLCVFLLGLHSTLFGPVKYAYMPQVLSERELTGGNGMISLGLACGHRPRRQRTFWIRSTQPSRRWHPRPPCVWPFRPWAPNLTPATVHSLLPPSFAVRTEDGAIWRSWPAQREAKSWESRFKVCA